MGLGHSVFPGGIARLALFRAELPVAGQPGFKLRLNFIAAAVLEWIGATAEETEDSERAENR